MLNHKVGIQKPVDLVDSWDLMMGFSKKKKQLNTSEVAEPFFFETSVLPDFRVHDTQRQF